MDNRNYQMHHPNCPRTNIFGGTSNLPQQRPVPRTAAKLAARQAVVPAVPEAPVPAAAPVPRAHCPRRTHLCAYASDFLLENCAMVPLEEQRTEGRLAMRDGVAYLPEDGYYMILWEMGVACAEGQAALHLKINDAAVPLAHQLASGYESGQQVTWLNAGDKLHLCIDAAEPARITCGSAQMTMIRLG